MSEAYRNLLSLLEGEEEERVKQSQVRWIKARDERCEPAHKMVEEAYYEELYVILYTERIEELREWKEYVDSGKTTNFPPWQTNCWKRQEPFRKQFWPITGDACVCRAFEQMLNVTCEAPKKLKRNWEVPSSEKRFNKLAWQPMDWREYWGLIEDMVKVGVREDIRREVWKRTEEPLREAFEEGRRSLSVTTVDIDHDGRSELVVRQDKRAPPGTVFGVMIPETKRLDWRYEPELSKINGGNEGAEIMLCQGKAYKFGLQSGWNFLFIWDENSRTICKLKYLKGEGIAN